MGYYAPSAEEVFRYAFRLDERNRSLTDRFGWSILLVNDGSDTCREFLQEYCVDLCFRTADRIRFVFFSGLPKEEIEGLLGRMSQGQGPASRGMLRGILDLLKGDRGRFRRYDYEEEPWRSLRPEPFVPLRRVEDIQKQLDLECELHTAMPGAGIALQFAQRLGIGRHVPCVLIFTDVGRLRVDIVPIKAMAPSEVYSHLRTWIDAFYELNQQKIDRWRKVEQDIESLCHQAQRSLWELRDWLNARRTAYRSLCAISETIRVLATAEHSAWGSMSAKVDELPWAARAAVKDFSSSLAELETRSANAAVLDEVVHKLKLLRSPEEMFRELTRLCEEVLPPLSLAVPSSVSDVIQAWRHRKAPPSVRDELYIWWRRYGPRRLSPKRFKSLRKNWVSLIGEHGRTIDEECAEMSEAVMSLPIDAEATAGSMTVLDKLAESYGIAPDVRWSEATKQYRKCVESYLWELLSATPQWLKTRLPGTSLRECIPSISDSSDFALDRFLSCSPLLSRAVEEATDELDGQREALAAERLNAFQNDRTVAVEAVERLVTLYRPRESDWRNAAEALLVQLRPLRSRLDAEAYDKAQEARSLSGASIDRNLAQSLHTALDEYDNIVETILYPHESDPIVRSVPIPLAATEAAGVTALVGKTRSIPEELRGRLKEAQSTEKEGLELLPQIASEAAKLTPAGTLCAALCAVLSPARVEIVLAQFVGFDTQERVLGAVRQHRTVELLGQLAFDELLRLATTLRKGNSNPASDASATEDALIEGILSGLGLFIAPLPVHDGRGGQGSEAQRHAAERTMRDEFDVFMAHNSADKAAVIDVGKRLRSAGLNPWIDIEQVPPGRWFQDVIQSIVPRVKAAAIFLGTRGVGRWQALEIRTFISQCVERNVPVIPVLLPGLKEFPDELLFLRELNYVRFERDLDDPNAVERLIWGITGRRVAGIA